MEPPLAPSAVLVLTQMPDAASAQNLARTLVENRLAACVSIGAPVSSLYHWKGQIETADEVPVMVKSRPDLYPEIEAAIRSLHPYEVPEILAFPASAALSAYVEWIGLSTQPPDAP